LLQAHGVFMAKGKKEGHKESGKHKEEAKRKKKKKK
jgi:hypothetical protein